MVAPEFSDLGLCFVFRYFHTLPVEVVSPTWHKLRVALGHMSKAAVTCQQPENYVASIPGEEVSACGLVVAMVVPVRTTAFVHDAYSWSPQLYLWRVVLQQ